MPHLNLLRLLLAISAAATLLALATASRINVQGSFFLKSASTNLTTSLKEGNNGAPQPPSPSTSNGATGKTNGGGAILGFTVLGAICLLTVGTITVVICWRCYRQHRDHEDEFIEVPSMITRFSFEQLKVATNQFTKKLGQGAFGSVFEGQLGEQRVAVKQLKRGSEGMNDFLAEIKVLGNIHHLNLVTLVGFCVENSRGLIVYEYMPNGSLDKWIYFQDTNKPLDWHIRCKIITDIAKGLAYLREECTQRIVHLDIKPPNILLDENFNAKIADFGLSKMFDRVKSKASTKTIGGTMGYYSPELFCRRRISEKADVYSFGVVVMEIICGRKNIDHSRQEYGDLIGILEEKAPHGQLEDLIDMNNSDMQMNKEKVIEMMQLAMWCLQCDYNRRPKMSDVVKVLEGAMRMENNDIEFDFTSTTRHRDFDFGARAPRNLGNDGEVASSALQASQLSGPR